MPHGVRPSNLNNFQRGQAAAQRKAFDQIVNSRILETYQIVLVPTQNSASDPHDRGNAPCHQQRSARHPSLEKLKSAGLVGCQLGAKIISEYLKNVPPWRGNHVAIRQLAGDFSGYLYLQGLRGPGALCEAIQDGGLTWTTWASDTFAYTESDDEKLGRYAGLKGDQQVFVSPDALVGVLVKPEVALAQIRADAEAAAAAAVPPPAVDLSGSTPVAAKLPPATSSSVAGPSAPAPAQSSKALYGTVN